VRDAPHRRHKAIAASGDGLNAASFRPPLVEHATEGGDLDRQIRILDHRPSPDGRYNLFFGHKTAGSLSENAKDIERPEPDRHRDEDAALVAPQQALPLAIEAEPLE